MTRIRTLLALLLIVGTGIGLAASTVAWNPEAFDPYEEDEGYIDFELDGDELSVVLVEEEGAIPATVEGDTLPLDEDLEEDRLLDPNALELYGGLPVDVGPTHVTVEVEGVPEEIDAAILSRLEALGLQAEQLDTAGSVQTYRLRSGDAVWRLSISHVANDTLLDLRAVRGAPTP